MLYCFIQDAKRLWTYPLNGDGYFTSKISKNRKEHVMLLRNTCRKIMSILLILTLVLGYTAAFDSVDTYAASSSELTLNFSYDRSTSTATLSWNKISGAKGYLLYRNGKTVKTLKSTTLKTNYREKDTSLRIEYCVKAYKYVKAKRWYNKKTKSWQKSKPARKYRGKYKYVKVKKVIATSNTFPFPTDSKATPSGGSTEITAKNVVYYYDDHGDKVGVKSFNLNYPEYNSDGNGKCYYYDIAGANNTYKVSKDNWYKFLTTKRTYTKSDGTTSTDSMSLLDAWTKLTDSLLEEGDGYTTHFDTYTDEFVGKSSKLNTDVDLANTSSKTWGKVSRSNSATTGLRTDKNTFSGVMEVMRDQVSARVDHKSLKREKSKILSNAFLDSNDYLEDHKDDTHDDMIFLVGTNVKERAFKYSNRYAYTSVALCFYDFALEPIGVDGIDDITDMPTTDDEYVERLETDSDTKTSYITNNNAESSITESITRGETETESRTVTTSNSTCFTYNESVNFSIGHKFGAVEAGFASEWTLSTGVTFGQSYTKGQSETYAEELNKNTTSTTTTQVPPYTQLKLEKTVEDRNLTYRLDVPMKLTYKVALLTLSADVYADDALNCNWMCATYKKGSSAYFFGVGDDNGENAAESLLNTAINGSVSGQKNYTFHGEGDSHANDVFDSGKKIDWTHVKTDVMGNGVNDALQFIVNNQAMITNGGSMTLKKHIITSEVSSPIPLYALSAVGISADRLTSDQEVDISGLDKKYIINRKIVCKGYSKDKNNVLGTYYGFNQADGYWVICDEYGNELESNDAFTLENGVITSKATGSGFITWRINETGANYSNYCRSADGCKTINPGTESEHQGEKYVVVEAPVIAVNIEA